MSSAARASIGRHPAFAPAVGLWFAALLGFGLFVMPAGVHAQIASRTGISGLLPAGIDERMAISAIGALLGFLFGLVIAQRVASANAELETDEWEVAPPEDSVWLSKKPAQEDPVEETPARKRRLFNPREELDEDGIGDSAAPEVLGEPAPSEPWREESRDLEEINEMPGDESEVAEADAPDDIRPQSDADRDEQIVTGIADGDTASAVDGPEHDDFEMPPSSEALGDLSLAALTEKLRKVIEAHRQHEAAPPAAEQAESEPGSQADDQVIAFLRREADRTGARMDEGRDPAEDPQAVLRSALDKLSRVSNPK